MNGVATIDTTERASLRFCAKCPGVGMRLRYSFKKREIVVSAEEEEEEEEGRISA